MTTSAPDTPEPPLRRGSPSAGSRGGCAASASGRPRRTNARRPRHPRSGSDVARRRRRSRSRASTRPPARGARRPTTTAARPRSARDAIAGDVRPIDARVGHRPISGRPSAPRRTSVSWHAEQRRVTAARPPRPARHRRHRARPGSNRRSTVSSRTRRAIAAPARARAARAAFRPTARSKSRTKTTNEDSHSLSAASSVSSGFAADTSAASLAFCSRTATTGSPSRTLRSAMTRPNHCQWSLTAGRRCPPDPAGRPAVARDALHEAPVLGLGKCQAGRAV